jgi:L-iditol 2-dehydrogenase
MKAAVLYGPTDLRVEELPEPTISADELLIRVTACGFCGSDVDYYFGTTPLLTTSGKGPLVLGHELAGEVLEAGDVAQEHGYVPGDRVAVNPIQSCNACDQCRAGRPQFCPFITTLGVSVDGGFAELTKTKYWHAYRLPPGLSDEEGAFVEMLASAVNAVRKAEIDPGTYAVIYGPGPVGLAMVQLAQQQGAQVAVVGTRDYRLELASELGAADVFNIQDPSSPYYTRELANEIRERNNGNLSDRVLVATGSIQAHSQALEISGGGSVVVFMGLTGPEDRVEVPLLANLYQDKTIRFSWQYPYRWPETIRTLERRRIATDKLITHRVTLDGIAEAIERVLAREDHVIKTTV